MQQIFMLRNISAVLLFSLIPLIVSAQDNKYGVFVGIGNYGDQAVNLPSSTQDARKVCEAFSPGCEGKNTILLLDKDATRDRILNSLESFRRKVKSGDLLFFYYSGHGVLFPDEDSEDIDEKILDSVLKKKKRAYDTAIVPFDAKSNTSGKPWKNLILDDELYRIFSKFTNNGAKVVFLSDSCHSGGLAKEIGSGDLKNPKLGRPKFLSLKAAIGLDEDQLKRPSVQHEVHPQDEIKELYLMIASSAENELSYSENPVTGTGNSLFTYYLLSELAEMKANKKQFTFNDIIKIVKPMVQKIAKENRAQQSPLINQDFYGGGNLNDPLF